MGVGGRCPQAWAFERPEEGDPEQGIPETPEEIYDPAEASDVPSMMHEDYPVPFVRGILGHDACGQTWRRHQALRQTGRAEPWATWTYALAYGLTFAAAPAPVTREQYDALEAKARKVAGWVDMVRPSKRLGRLHHVVDNTRQDCRIVVDAVAKWHRDRWAHHKVDVIAVETPLRLWVDASVQQEGAEDRKARYGVVDPPEDEQRRLRLYRALKGPDWRHALRMLVDLGPPFLTSSRLDMAYRTPEGRIRIVDLKTGMRAGSLASHQGYQHSDQIIAIDTWGRCFVPGYEGFDVEYLPWVGSASSRPAGVSEVHRRDLAWSVERRLRNLAANTGRPAHRWAKTLDEQACRTIYSDPCPFYDTCRGG